MVLLKKPSEIRATPAASCRSSVYCHQRAMDEELTMVKIPDRDCLFDETSADGVPRSLWGSGYSDIWSGTFVISSGVLPAISWYPNVMMRGGARCDLRPR